MKRWIVSVFVCLLLLPVLSHATIRFVAPAGNNSNSCAASAGTLGSPSATPKQTLASALPCMVAGDTLYLRAGTYPEINQNAMAIPSGTSFANPITIAGFPGETITITNRVLVTTAQFLIVQHFKVAGYSGDNGITVINTDGGGNIADTRVRFVDFEVSGVVGQQGVFTYANRTEFLQCKVYGVQAGGSSVGIHGFYLNGHSNIIDGCDIYNNAGFGVQLYNGTTNTQTHDSIIRNNRVHQNAQHCIGGCGGMTLDSGDNILAYNNLVYNNLSNGIEVAISAGGTKIYNNTTYGNSGSGVRLENGGGRGVFNTQVKNNILADGMSNGSVNAVLSSNLCQNAGTGCTIVGNPLFASPGSANFTLLTGSPAINAGVPLSDVPTDLLGTVRPQGAAYDLGAYETTAAPPATQVAFTTQPANTAAGQTMPTVVVSIQDASGNLVSSSAASVTLAIGNNPAGGTLSGTLTRTAVNGLASFPGLSINNAGLGYTLTATSSGLTGATSASFAITTATQLAFVAQPQNATPGQTMPAVTVRVLDNLGNLVSGSGAVITLAIATNPSDGKLVGSTQVNAVNGVATFTPLSLSQGSITLAWDYTQAEPPGPQATEFRVSRQAGCTGTFVPLATVPVSQQTYVDNALVAGNLYCWQVTALGGLGEETIPTNPASWLAVNGVGVGYTLVATSPGLTPATSQAFTIAAALPESMEWIPAQMIARSCARYNGDTNDSSVWPAGTDFPHSLACTIPAPSLRLGAILRICTLMQVAVGTGPPRLQFALKSGGVVLARYTGFATSPPSTVLNNWWCSTLRVQAAPGTTAGTSTSMLTYPAAWDDPSANAVAQPVPLDTTTDVTLTMSSQWESVGTGGPHTNTQRALTVEMSRQ